MRKISVFILSSVLLMSYFSFCGIVSETEALESLETDWIQTYGGTSEERGFSVVETSDGGYALAGSTISFGAGGIDVYLVRTDSDGNML
jgi:hypothetical protein